ncbi:hypothetical protein BDF20DRAFT_837815 [Mycotypha africana]|uniref:uncharacterized protein n=1 Tax=Mycotypha africana TaxID=64632 RepID=UPI002300FF5B|nr:uncharacterized protein BDF20DRAFT_837815 [Mycotypha africana]KAI8971490.1 hypothetical protein BDF20DRAFT_837815 [Mycotypha africana]
MGAQTVDYRVSRLVVLCKDCGNDVGLYPARHKCQPVDRPAMPALPIQYSSTDAKRSSSTSPSSSFSSRLSHNTNKTTATAPNVQEEEDSSVYLNNFTANLPEQQQQDSNGKKLWGKVRQNEKWKQLTEKNDKSSKQTGKLWGKLLQATQSMADKIPSREDRGPDSDEDDWEGETHVSRILREYYERKQQPLPHWLMDDDVDPTRRRQGHKLYAEYKDSDYMDPPASSRNDILRSHSRRRLWEQDNGENNSSKNLSSRERERQELRQQARSDSQFSRQRRPISNDYDQEEKLHNNHNTGDSSNRRDYGRYGDRSDETRSYQHHSNPDRNYSHKEDSNTYSRMDKYNNGNYATSDSGGHRDREDAFAGDNRRLLQHRSRSTMDSSKSRHYQASQQQLSPIRSGRSVRGYNGPSDNSHTERGNSSRTVYPSAPSTPTNYEYARSEKSTRPSFADSNRPHRYGPPEPGYF